LRLLLDTHAFLWAVEEPNKLSQRAREAVETTDNELYLSAVSALEVALKVRRRRLHSLTSGSAFTEAATGLGTRPLPVSLTHALRVYEMPRYHDDPFDLLLIAQGMVEGLSIVTNDRMFVRYDIEVVW
jgi:PIN domain nuclease of toxin-antitoxin system